MNTLNTIDHWLNSLTEGQVILWAALLWSVVAVVWSIARAAMKGQLTVEGSLSIRALLLAARRGIVATTVAIFLTLLISVMLNGIGDCPHGSGYDCTPDTWTMIFAMGMLSVTGLALLALVLIPLAGALAVLIMVVWKILMFFLRPIARGVSYSYRVVRPHVRIVW